MKNLSEPITRRDNLGPYDRCAAYATLYAFVCTRSDLGAVDAWRKQRSVNIKADGQCQNCNHMVVQRFARSLASYAFSDHVVELVDAYRHSQRVDEPV